jgi:hypothetical protein
MVSRLLFYGLSYSISRRSEGEKGAGPEDASVSLQYCKTAAFRLSSITLLFLLLASPSDQQPSSGVTLGGKPSRPRCVACRLRNREFDLRPLIGYLLDRGESTANSAKFERHVL